MALQYIFHCYSWCKTVRANFHYPKLTGHWRHSEWKIRAEDGWFVWVVHCCWLAFIIICAVGFIAHNHTRKWNAHLKTCSQTTRQVTVHLSDFGIFPWAVFKKGAACSLGCRFGYFRVMCTGQWAVSKAPVTLRPVLMFHRCEWAAFGLLWCLSTPRVLVLMLAPTCTSSYLHTHLFLLSMHASSTLSAIITVQVPIPTKRPLSLPGTTSSVEYTRDARW
jgi:hypothetical protein